MELKKVSNKELFFDICKAVRKLQNAGLGGSDITKIEFDIDDIEDVKNMDFILLRYNEQKEMLQELIKLGLVKKQIRKEESQYAGKWVRTKRGNTVFKEYDKPKKFEYHKAWYTLTDKAVDYINTLKNKK